jgi:GNAT superfamily N-acetyltransferase
VTTAVTIRHARTDDAGQVLVVQRAAYVLDAQLYGDPMIDALTETFEDVLASVADANAVLLVAADGDRLVGFVRGYINGRSCRLDRLAVVPDRQGGGVGGALVQAIEADVDGLVDELLADDADRGQARVRLYQRHGFIEIYRDAAGDGRVRIYLRKDLDQGRAESGKNGRHRGTRSADSRGTTDAGQQRRARTPATLPPSPLLAPPFLAPPSRPWRGTYPDHPTGG